LTKYGILGVKVWIYKWDIMEKRRVSKKLKTKKSEKK
jgi:ribosomal protein S3